jgi:hypothetical protein
MLRSLAVCCGFRSVGVLTGAFAENWAQKAREFDRETDIIRDSTRRMDRFTAQADRSDQGAAE